MELFKTEKIYDLMGKRAAFLGLSGILVIASIILLLTKGLNFGIDFAGGTIIQVKYDKVAPINEIRDTLKSTKYIDDILPIIKDLRDTWAEADILSRKKY